jgi:hypothetical protein
MRLNAWLVAGLGAVAAVAVAAFLLDGTQARTDSAGSRQAARSLEPLAESGSNKLVAGQEHSVSAAHAESDTCRFFEGFYALRNQAGEIRTASANDGAGESQTNKSTQRTTTRSGSRVAINGVVVHDDVVEETRVQTDDSSGSQVQSISQNSSVSVSTSVGSSGSRTRVVVNGEVVKDVDTGLKDDDTSQAEDEATSQAQVQSSLAGVMTAVVAKWLQFESKFVVNWYFSAVAGPACAAQSP